METAGDPPVDPLAAWLQATEGSAADVPEHPEPQSRAPSRSARRLAIIAALPWAVVIVLGVAVVNRSTPPMPPAGAALPIATPDPTPATSPATAPALAASPATPLDDELRAVAVLAVRLAAGPAEYVDTAVAAGAETVGDATIVTVAATLLEREGARWLGPREVRYAVAIAATGRPRVVLGSPWLVPSTPVPVTPPPADEVDDAALTTAARTVLRDAGYQTIAALELRRLPSIPDVLTAQVSARAPGSTTPADHVVWLDAAATRILGAARGGGTDLPVPVPAEQP